MSKERRRQIGEKKTVIVRQKKPQEERTNVSST